MHVLVTGAGGFIGSHLVEELVRGGHQVRAMDLGHPGAEIAPSPDVEWIVGDVTREDDCARAVEGCDGLAHLAARVTDWGSRDEFVRINAEGTRKLQRAAREARLHRFLLVSSVAVHHFDGWRGATEDTPRDRPMNAYALSKIMAEDIVRADASLPWTIIRPGVFPFGPRDRTSFLPLARVLRKGGPGFVGGGQAVLCTAYVENLVEGIRLALERPEGAGETFVLADPWEITWRGLFERFAQELEVRPPRLSVPFAVAWTLGACCEGVYGLAGSRGAPPLTRYRALVAGRDCHFASDKAARLLGYKPRVDLDEAVRRTVAWFRSVEEP